MASSRLRPPRWDEMVPIVEEHMAAYATEPAVECHFVRDGPLIAASALAHMGQLDQAHSLAAVPGDPAAHPATATAWQAWYLVASGEPEAARAIAGNSHSSSHGHCEVMTRAGRG